MKETQLFYLVIKLTKPFAVPEACMRWKSKRGIGIISFEPIVMLLLSIIVIVSMKKYDTNTALSFSSLFGTARTILWFVNLITK